MHILTASKHEHSEQAGLFGVNQRSKKSHKEISQVGKIESNVYRTDKKICPGKGQGGTPGNQQEPPFRMSQIPVPQPNRQVPRTCSAFCLSALWSVAAPQEGHQERGSHTGLAAAALGYIPGARPEGYLGRQEEPATIQRLS